MVNAYSNKYCIHNRNLYLLKNKEHTSKYSFSSFFNKKAGIFIENIMVFTLIASIPLSAIFLSIGGNKVYPINYTANGLSYTVSQNGTSFRLSAAEIESRYGSTSDEKTQTLRTPAQPSFPRWLATLSFNTPKL